MQASVAAEHLSWKVEKENMPSTRKLPSRSYSALVNILKDAAVSSTEKVSHIVEPAVTVAVAQSSQPLVTQTPYVNAADMQICQLGYLAHASASFEYTGSLG
jgi:hypothetical protein